MRTCSPSARCRPTSTDGSWRSRAPGRRIPTSRPSISGSRAVRAAGPRSDVDLAVALRGGLEASARWRKRLDLIGDACARLGTDTVDVVVLEDAPALLGHRVLARGRLLCERDPRRRVQVAERVMRQYLDEAHLRAVLDAGLGRRVREGRFGR